MEITVDEKVNGHLTLEQAFQFEIGTLFKIYNSNFGNSLGIAIRARDANQRPIMVQLYSDKGTVVVFSEDPRYPFSFELLGKDSKVTLIQK